MILSDNALKVLEKRYFDRDENGDIREDWPQLIQRVASNISDGDEEKYERYYRLLDSGYFLPNSPTLMNAGRDLQQLSACFVLPIEDSMESIFGSVRNAALIHKSGGGTGFSFNRLRQADSRVRSTNGVSSGPISFLKVFNAATDAVKQGGTRRGANMAILNVDHPDILDFIRAKEDTRELTNFNISIGLTDKFMQALTNGAEYELVEPHTGKVVNNLRADDVFTLIVDMAYKNGEPGIIFLDTINRFNPTPQLGRIESTNPCGEQPLLPNEACNLGSVNLSLMVQQGKFDFALLKQVVETSTEFLDDVIDRSCFPLPEIEMMVKGNRKIGLGLMGWADLLYILKIPYNSEQALLLATKIMEQVDYHSKKKSMLLARERGSFPNFPDSVYDQGTLLREDGREDWKELIKELSANGIRNATTTTIAPTGTISMIADTSSGIEPQFSLVYIKNVMDGEKLLYVNPHFEKAIREAGLYSSELMEKVAEMGSICSIPEIPAPLREVFITAHDITPEWHIRMQAAFQKYTDNAVSKTINFPCEASREEIRQAYELAYTCGCKGVTVYRDGSRENQVLNVGKTVADTENGHRVEPRERPFITRGVTQKIETGCGHLYITINSDEEGACEVFTQIGKVGACASAQMEAIARLTSLCLRSNIKLTSIIKQLQGIRCPSPMWYKGEMVTSCADGLAKALQKYINIGGNTREAINEINIQAQSPDYKKKSHLSGICPDCGSTIEHSEGCLKCNFCGWSKC